ncbi:MAG: hypothetical protein OXK73_04090 [Rhodospirillaceae bacterium]|nr:hypothetical protein [Rhodospirillaceae bacterium]
MRWPWQWGREARQSSYTDQLVNALVAHAQGTSTTDAHATAALESCAALYAAAFTRARLEPMVAAATPAFLALVARTLIRRGELVADIQTDGGMVAFVPAGTHEVRGLADEATWTYRVHRYGPSRAESAAFRQGAGVLHFRYAVDPARPWQGVSPLAWASATASLAGRLEAGLSQEAGAPAAQLLPVPQDGGDGGDNDPLAQLKTDIAKAKGRAVLVETTAAGWGTGQGGAPRRDWVPSRIGFNPPDVSRTIRDDVFQHVAAACNVPGVLLDPRSEGTSQREGLRRFAHLGLEPLGELIAAELAAKLDMPALRFDFSMLMASDLAGKARAVGILAKAGVELPEALRLAGLAA